MKKILLILVLLFFWATPYQCGAQEEILSVMGTAPVTEKLTITDVSTLLTTLFDATYAGTDPTWTKVKSIFVTCEDNDVRISFGRAAVQGASPMGHILAVGQSLRIPSMDLVRKAYVINKTNGSAGNLMVTVER